MLTPSLSLSPAVVHAQTYWSILERRLGTDLRLTRLDQEIHDHLFSAFPEFDPKKPLSEDEMKGAEGKARWREFLMKYEKRVDDYNFGTLLRTDAGVEYEKDTTIFGLLPTPSPCFPASLLFFFAWYRGLCGGIRV